MLLQYLESFCRVVDEGSFTKAAESLGFSQPTVTKQIAGVEEGDGSRPHPPGAAPATDACGRDRIQPRPPDPQHRPGVPIGHQGAGVAGPRRPPNRCGLYHRALYAASRLGKLSATTPSCHRERSHRDQSAILSLILHNEADVASPPSPSLTPRCRRYDCSTTGSCWWQAPRASGPRKKWSPPVSFLSCR